MGGGGDGEMAMCMHYLLEPKLPGAELQGEESSYVSINLTDDGSGAETDNTYESIRSIRSRLSSQSCNGGRTPVHNSEYSFSLVP